MADNEAAVLEQAQTLQRAKQLQARLQAKAKDPSEPGVAAIGNPDGPQAQAAPPTISDMAKNDPASIAYEGPPTAIDRAMEPVKRVMSVPAGVTRVAATGAIGNLLPSANGKNMAENSDYMDALKGNAPGVGDMAARKYPGLAEGLKAILNKGGNFALDPLMWGGLQKLGKGMYNSTINPIEVQGEQFGKAAVGDELNKQGIWNPFTLKKTIQPIVDAQMDTAGKMEQQATAAGGSPVMKKAMGPAQAYVDSIMKYAKPGSAQEKMAVAMQKEIDLHLQMDAKAAQKAFVELPYTEQAKSLEYAGPNPESELHLAAGTKGPSLTSASNGVTETVPGGPVQQNEIIHRLDARGKPIVNTVPLKKMPDARVIESDPTKLDPGGRGGNYEINKLPVQGNYDIKTQVTPKLDVGEAMQEQDLAYPNRSEVRPGATPMQGAQWKKDAYGNATNSAYNTETRNTPWQGFYKMLGHGLKGAVEESVGQGLGPEAQAAYRTNNESTGKLLSTGKAQMKVQNQSGRDLDRMLDPTAPTDMLASAAGGHGDLEQMLKVGSIMKAIRAARLAKMPVGYALRNIPENVTTGASALNNFNAWGNTKNGEK